MVLDMVRITDALPVLSSVFGYEEVRYMPSVLLDVSSLPAALVDHLAFADGCRVGSDGWPLDM